MLPIGIMNSYLLEGLVDNIRVLKMVISKKVELIEEVPNIDTA